MERRDNIELRSEKVRHIIGRIPPSLIRTGTTVIALMVMAMAVAIYTIHYPITIEARGEVVQERGNLQVQLLIPFKYVSLFNEPMTAAVEFEGADGTFTNKIVSHDTTIIPVNKQNYFAARTDINKDSINGIPVQVRQKVSARILVKDKTIWQLLNF